MTWIVDPTNPFLTERTSPSASYGSPTCSSWLVDLFTGSPVDVTPEARWGGPLLTTQSACTNAQLTLVVYGIKSDLSIEQVPIGTRSVSGVWFGDWCQEPSAAVGLTAGQSTAYVGVRIAAGDGMLADCATVDGGKLPIRTCQWVSEPVTIGFYDPFVPG